MERPASLSKLGVLGRKTTVPVFCHEGSYQSMDTEHVSPRMLSVFCAFCCLYKRHDQKQISEEKDHFTSQLTVFDEGTSGRNSKQEARDKRCYVKSELNSVSVSPHPLAFLSLLRQRLSGDCSAHRSQLLRPALSPGLRAFAFERLFHQAMQASS